MKRLTSLLAMAALTVSVANAQVVLGYSVAQTQGTYTPLQDGTVIFDGADHPDMTPSDFRKLIYSPSGECEAWGDPVEGYALGFDINIAGTTYRNFLVSPLGYVYLGTGAIDYNTYMGENFLTYGRAFTIVGFANTQSTKCNADTKVSYQVVGTGADASLVVDYANLCIADPSDSNYTPVNMQLSISAAGKITVVCDKFTNLADGTKAPFNMGVRQLEDYVRATGTTGSVSSASNGGSQLELTNATASGTTVTFNVPDDCETPASQPTELKLNATSDAVEGEFLASPEADTYLVVYSLADAAVENPVDGTLYQKDDKLGEGTVTYYGPATSFNTRNLDASKDYQFKVYSVSAYGYNGPKYNTSLPLTANVTTAPAGVTEAVFADATATSFSMTVTPNDADDDIVVLYNSYCYHDPGNYGDFGLFGDIPADAKAGDVIPAPADFEPYYNFEGAPMPANAGTIAYIGKAGQKIVLDNLDPSTSYFIRVLTRDANGVYTSQPLNTGWSTNIQYPYDGSTYSFPRYRLPYGWTSTGAAASEMADAEYRNRTTNLPSQGTQILQPTKKSLKGNAVNGVDTWLTPATVYVNDRHVMAQFDYCLQASMSRFSTVPFNDWEENDVVELQVSEDNGETWTALQTYTRDSHPRQEELASYVSIKADLNEYRGKTIQVRFYFKSYSVPAGYGFNVFIDRFSLTQADFPAVPEVTVGGITDNSAVASWTCKHNDYQLMYFAKDSNCVSIVDVKGAKSYTMENLYANTVYEVMVRGVLADETSGEQTGYSEWSDPVEFTTLDYPEIDAPEGLKTDVETLAELGYVILSWDKVAEAGEYEVAYRLSASTEWTYVKTSGIETILTDLEGGETYIWKVRAYCTHDRVTNYSAQVSFEAPVAAGVTSVGNGMARIQGGRGVITIIGADRVQIFSTSGARIAAGANRGEYRVAPGIYIVSADGKTSRIFVR